MSTQAHQTTPNRTRTAITSWLAMLALVMTIVGCESNSGTGAAVGGSSGAVAGGAAAGAAAGAPAAGVGAIVGGAVGAVGGAIIGASQDRSDADRTRAERASADNPALASAVVAGGTADINSDGFVTLDEIVALERSGLSDEEIIARCRNTQQIFTLSGDQQRALMDAGVSPRVAASLRDLNRELGRPGPAGVQSTPGTMK